MHIKHVLGSLLLCIALSLQAHNTPPLLEAKPSYFFFSNATLDSVYQSGGPQVQVSGSYPFCKMMEVYGSIGYLQANGKLLNSNEKTSASEITFDLGLKRCFRLSEKMSGHIAAGPRYFSFQQCNDFQYINTNLQRPGLGIFLNAGLKVLLAKHLFMGIFGEYSYESASFSSSLPNVYGQSNAQVGGFSLGASIGYEF